MQAISRVLLGLLVATLAVGLVIFGVQNTEAVKIEFLNFAIENISISLVMIGSVIMGAALVWLLGLWRAAQLSLRHRREAKERTMLATQNKALDVRVKELERELDRLRTGDVKTGDTMLETQAAAKKTLPRS